MKVLSKVLIVFVLTIYAAGAASAQEIPYVYDVEHTGAAFPAPLLPAINELRSEHPLPDPFAWSDGSGRSTKFSDWKRRRAEIKAEIEHYGIGTKPPRPENVTAQYANGMLTVNVTENDQTLTLRARVILPEGEGPFPAVIGIFGPTGSLPSDIFENRKIARIVFDFGQVIAHTQNRGREPINRLFPELTHIGAYSAWPWGVSRLIDGLELEQKDLPIDLKRIAVTGCSFAGKMALFAGEFDERIALTIAQEPGGGGAAAWRVSETLGEVETLGRTSRAWFLKDMFRFANSVHKLPYDHHELVAMVAPRALLILGNPSQVWLAEKSGYVSARAAHEVWKTLGVGDRLGFSFVGGHPHCQIHPSQKVEIEAFVDKFLLGKKDVDTNLTRHEFEGYNHEMWYDGWAKGKSTFPLPDKSNVESFFFEAEEASIGSQWQVLDDSTASGSKYVTIQPNLNSIDAPPPGEENSLRLSFEVKRGAKFYIFGMVKCPSADDDSFWVKVDNGDFVQANGLSAADWTWAQLLPVDLSPGKHTLTIAYREDGALLDRIAITTYPFGPAELEE